MALSIQGRALVALDRATEAAHAFEAAASIAHSTEMWMAEAIALRDLKLSVLDKMGHGDHASRRLGAVLRRMTATADLLKPMLKGLDAAELMSLSAPEAGYVVVYSTEDAATVKLREELQAMKVMALQSRAQAEGVSPDEVEDAMESDRPKKQLVELLVILSLID